ncbi:hypothetical protein RGU12_20430 [Fredinandcohnia sp. QZ13]|uniref:hypothetical protein n=1 Tax=Fredinandcohnia sp. QZ13 TaxID=3073144 RepID=UPI00285339F4|nr:hypothetical protein [Fredinandcohnia sp. QZ13]MDR4889865.1 hypothetical protein [Fredinandcohnia sp. QZ13]
MWYYWFTLIFCLSIVLMALIIIPRIIIALGIETIRERLNKPRTKKSEKGKPFENVKFVMQFTGALLVFALVATFLGYMSVPYLHDFPHVIQREYSSEEGYIDDVYDPGKSWDNEVEVNGELFYSTKIKEKHEGRFMTFEYLPNTKLIVSYKLWE